MEIFLLTLVVLMLLTLGMSVGVLLGRKPIAGSCGGLSALGMTKDCEICGGQKNQIKRMSMEQQEDLAYDASKTIP